MRVHALVQGELRPEVGLQVGGLLHDLDKCLIDLLLGRDFLRRQLLLFRLGFLVLHDFRRLIGGLTLEVLVIDSLHVAPRDVNLRRGGDNVALVDATQRDSIHRVRASHEQQSTGQLLQEHGAHSAESAGEHDEDLSGGDGLAQTRRLLNRLARRHRCLHIIGGVPLRALVLENRTCASVLLTSDLLHDSLRRGLNHLNRKR